MLVSELRNGAVAGLVATAPMSIAMKAMKEELPWYERYALPPRIITRKFGQKSGLMEDRNEPGESILTLLAHFGYGAAVGALYAPIAHKLKKIPALVKGMVFGLVVWATSYFGLLPALGLMRPAHKQPFRRTALMIAAHLVWGAVLGLLAERGMDKEKK